MQKFVSPRAAQQTAHGPARRPLTDTERRTELSRLLPIWPHEREDLSLAGRQFIVRKLERALRVERQRGRAGHWTYDVARHAALARAWRDECTALRALTLKLALSKRHSPRTRGLSMKAYRPAIEHG